MDVSSSSERCVCICEMKAEVSPPFHIVMTISEFLAVGDSCHSFVRSFLVFFSLRAQVFSATFFSYVRAHTFST
jgi:hypothetical protein